MTSLSMHHFLSTLLQDLEEHDPESDTRTNFEAPRHDYCVKIVPDGARTRYHEEHASSVAAQSPNRTQKNQLCSMKLCEGKRDARNLSYGKSRSNRKANKVPCKWGDGTPSASSLVQPRSLPISAEQASVQTKSMRAPNIDKIPLLPARPPATPDRNGARKQINSRAA
jgi:hypothetical protein